MKQPHTLDELRQLLGDVDKKLIELVAERQKIASEIGRIKRTMNMPTRDFRQERDVVERARALASQHGVDAELVRDILLRLIRSSLTVQEQEGVAAHAKGSGKTVLIIGGAGKMGQWFARFLSAQGYSVDLSDPAGAVEGFGYVADWKAEMGKYAVIIVAAQLRHSVEILREIARQKPPGLVFDIASLKSPLRAVLKEVALAGVRVTSIHPMFGPSTDLLSGRHVLFVDVGHAEANAQAREMFSHTMAMQTELGLDAHDRLIAYILGLSHALNIAFFTALAESGETAHALSKLSSTTFDAQLAVAGRVAEENPHLYFEIQSLNDYGTESLSALLYAIERIRSVVRAGDEAGFVALMEKGRTYMQARAKVDGQG